MINNFNSKKNSQDRFPAFSRVYPVDSNLSMNDVKLVYILKTTVISLHYALLVVTEDL